MIRSQMSVKGFCVADQLQSLFCFFLNIVVIFNFNLFLVMACVQRLMELHL